MDKTVPAYRAALVSLIASASCVGLVALGTGCPGPTPTPSCTTDDDCADDGLYCNGEEVCVNGQCGHGGDPCTGAATCDEDENTCVVEGCQSDDDCGIGEFCDVVLAECILNENLFRIVALDLEEDGGNFTAIHLANDHGDPANCAACHHADHEAGFQSCRTAGCHSDDPNGVNSYKDVAHDQNESNDGCAASGCHADDFVDNCALCHLLLRD
jgi:hypothetical protein